MLLAGFEVPDTGEIFLDGQAISRIPPFRRNIGVVFQNYALFPHMTAGENIGFALRQRGVSRGEIRSLVAKVLELVQMTGLESRYPRQLSGGQQQRVAIARALIGSPSVVFADEPTGALDLVTGAEVLGLLGSLVRAAGATVVMVTHDPVAASRADRVVFLADGRIAGEILRPEVDAVAARMAHLADRGQAAAAATARTEPSW
jgi:ABC-type Fe3+/spermidine/putrescine transport system ATPase subunit